MGLVLICKQKENERHLQKVCRQQQGGYKLFKKSAEINKWAEIKQICVENFSRNDNNNGGTQHPTTARRSSQDIIFIC
jgi:hypothetical protein